MDWTNPWLCGISCGIIILIITGVSSLLFNKPRRFFKRLFGRKLQLIRPPCFKDNLVNGKTLSFIFYNNSNEVIRINEIMFQLLDSDERYLFKVLSDDLPYNINPRQDSGEISFNLDSNYYNSIDYFIVITNIREYRFKCYYNKKVLTSKKFIKRNKRRANKAKKKGIKVRTEKQNGNTSEIYANRIIKIERSNKK